MENISFYSIYIPDSVLVLLLLVLPLVVTYLITWGDSVLTLYGWNKLRKPPKVPYLLPGVGHVLLFLTNQTLLASSIRSYFKDTTSLRLSFFHIEVNVVSGADAIASIWKSKAFEPKPAICMSLDKFFRTPARALETYLKDDSGVKRAPHPASNVAPEDRIHRQNYITIREYMSGKTLKRLAARFQVLLAKLMFQQNIDDDWTQNEDLYEFIQNLVSTATIEVLCGPTLLTLNPNWVRDFWEFDSSVSSFLKGYPRWLAPKAWKIRQKVLDGLKAWRTFARNHFVEDMIDETGDDPLYGTRLMRTREEYQLKMSGSSQDSLVSEDLGLIWAANANVVPISLWLVLETIRNPGLLRRVQTEVDGCCSEDGTLDASKLCAQPLLQSIYAEALRLRTALFIVREADHDDFHLNGFNLEKGKRIIIDTYTSHMDSKVWNSGPPDNPHPLDTFWAERFLVDPEDPCSGPLSQNHPLHHAKRSQRPSQRPTPDRESRPKFSMKGLDGAWVPFGGGIHICPGLQFAKQNILLSVAMAISSFEIELLTMSDLKPDTVYYGLGVLPPKGKVPFRIRRKVCDLP
ncbi:MAG: hypothetical protein M1822_008495 [Bathelium mastoideum]|nr:MAG: hypothetical protein M1822_008495 [Bathelium mastoideum]